MESIGGLSQFESDADGPSAVYMDVMLVTCYGALLRNFAAKAEHMGSGRSESWKWIFCGGQEIMKHFSSCCCVVLPSLRVWMEYIFLPVPVDQFRGVFYGAIEQAPTWKSKQKTKKRIYNFPLHTWTCTCMLTPRWHHFRSNRRGRLRHGKDVSSSRTSLLRWGECLSVSKPCGSLLHMLHSSSVTTL